MFGKTKDQKEEEARIDKKLELYEASRKLEIDEKLSEYRRKVKNDSVDAVKVFADEIMSGARAAFSGEIKAVKSHTESVSARQTEISMLDAQIVSKKAEAVAADKDFEARGLLRERAVKAEREKDAVIIAEKDKMIALLEAQLKTVTSETTGLLKEAVKSLGSAADKEAVTKVVGFGPSSEPKKV